MNEYNDDEMMPCDICEEFWPSYEMTEFEDSRVVCPDCFAEIEG